MKPDEAPAELIALLSQNVGCPLPCMGREETAEVYRQVLAVVLPVHERQVREQVAKEAEAWRCEQPSDACRACACRADFIRIARGEQP